MSLVLGLWLVCGFFANLPTASSIQCYSCGDWPGSKDPCKGSSAIQCESYFDSCSTIKTKVEFSGMDSNQTLKNCSIAESPNCNQTYMCEFLNKSVVAAGAKLLQCDVSCCQTDRCNGPDEDEANPTTPGPDPQSELRYYIETFRALLDELEYIVDKELEGQLSATVWVSKNDDTPLRRKQKSKRVEKVLNDFYVAVANEEEQKSNNAMDEMKTSVAELMKKPETNRGQSKRKQAAAYQFLNEAMESLVRLAAEKR